jgi:hypothetical protein
VIDEGVDSSNEDDDVDGEGVHDDGSESLASLADSMKKVGKRVGGGIQDWPVLRGQLAWRDLPMVRKHAGKAFRVIPSRDVQPPQISLAERLRPGYDSGELLPQGANGDDEKNGVKVLGQKSFWLESTREATRVRQERELEAFKRLRYRPSLYRTTAPPPVELLEVPLVERRERFFGFLQAEVDKENIIRDELSDGD